MIGMLFFGTLALVFLIVTKFSQWFFQFLNRKIGFADFSIWKKCTIYGLYFFSIFMVFFGDEWLGRIQHKYMCEKYAYLKYDREGLFTENLKKGDIDRKLFPMKKISYTILPMKSEREVWKNKYTDTVYINRFSIYREGGWIARWTGVNFVSFLNKKEIFFKVGSTFGQYCTDEKLILPNDIGNRIRYYYFY